MCTCEFLRPAHLLHSVPAFLIAPASTYHGGPPSFSRILRLSRATKVLASPYLVSHYPPEGVLHTIETHSAATVLLNILNHVEKPL